ncbi:MAG: polyprenyl synthetase family protein [Clostridia bacterium]|nr:polyprenyl synthetase family protein [Clostridia bacterium]
MEIYTPILAAHCRRLEEALPTLLPAPGGPQDTVVRAMIHGCADGGKRIRPVLTMEFCRLLCGDAEPALPFAAAVEMIHSYSLIHDDMPCMDNSPLRRGKPAVHTAFGEDMALLAGDGLLTFAFETMLSDTTLSTVPADRAAVAAGVLARAAGVYGMVGGQTIDIESDGKQIPLSRLEQLQEGKTGALLRAACEMGVVVGGGDETARRAAAAFGDHLGRSFQMTDDILDVTASADALGKPTGSDAVNEKVTYVSLLGLDKTRELAAEQTAAAIKALDAFSGDTESLKQLAIALLHRDR